jgi:MerR family mercuric resistance operon transcriptional regulator
MKIGELARQADVAVDSVRYYERRGLLPAPTRLESGYRTYGADDAQQLRFIRRAKALGFSLEEIRELLRLSAAGNGERAEVRRIARHRLDDVEAKLRELQAVRDVLAGLVAQCSGRGPVAGCPIIETVLGGDPASKEH